MFEIQSWRHGEHLPTPPITTDIFEILASKMPRFPTENTALRNGKPYPPTAEINQPAKPKTGTEDRKNN